MKKTIQSHCKSFRENVLQITLKEMELKTGVKVGTISAFENGNSNNINHLFNYVVSCETEMQLKEFHNVITLALSKGE